MLLAASALKGYAIDSQDGPIGKISDLLFDDTTWKVRWLVIDTGTWLTTRKVLVHPSAIAAIDVERERLSVALSRQKIEASPSILQDRPVSQQMQNSVYDYYGWDPLWGGVTFGEGAIASTVSVPPPYGTIATMDAEARVLRGDEGDPHLRSTAEVTGYHVHATDGEIGHVENLLVDDAAWTIRYLIIDTRNWWAGQHVLVSPYAVSTVRWSGRQVALDITRAQVKESPPWDPAAVIDEFYQKRLHSYYGWPGYGW